MSTFSLRIDDSFKSELEEQARTSGKSLNELLVNYIRLAKTISDYTDKNSQVFIKRAKGFDADQSVVVPVRNIIGG